MNDIPLHAFLSSLAADEIILTVRDYDRLLLAFQTGGSWTLTRACKDHSILMHGSKKNVWTRGNRDALWHRFLLLVFIVNSVT